MTTKSARKSCVIVLAALCVLALPAIALASLPKLKSSLIVPNKSIGPLKLNVSYATAVKEAGTTKGGHCIKTDSCQWGTEKSGELTFQMGSLTTSKAPFVVEITITAPTESAKGKTGHYFTGPLMKLKTSKKIGLGSSTKSLTKAYPHMYKEVVSATTYVYVIYGSGPSTSRPQTDFIVDNKRVVTISTQAIPLG